MSDKYAYVHVQLMVLNLNTGLPSVQSNLPVRANQNDIIV